MADPYALLGVAPTASHADLQRSLAERLAKANADGDLALRSQLLGVRRLVGLPVLRALYDQRAAVQARPDIPKAEDDYFAVVAADGGGIDPKSFKAPLAVSSRPCNALADHSVLTAVGDTVHERLAQPLAPALVEWAVGAALGMVVGDAFGAGAHGDPTPADPKPGVFRPLGSAKLNLRPGQWSAVGAAGLCLLDSFFVHNALNSPDFLIRLFNWAHFGYNDSTAYDTGRPSPPPSPGLDPAAAIALQRLITTGTVNAAPGPGPSSSAALSRCAAVAVGCSANPEAAVAAARAQCLATDPDEVTAELCGLLTHLLFKARDLQPPRRSAGDLLFKIEFDTSRAEVRELMASTGMWNWKDPDALKLPPERLGPDPRRFGLAARDCLFVALHCVWSTDTLRDALIMAGGVCGQACQVGAVVGQLAGALYGLSGFPQDWVDAVQKWDRGGSIVLRAVLALQQQHPQEQG